MIVYLNRRSLIAKPYREALGTGPQSESLWRLQKTIPRNRSGQ